ncbi:MAG TPA: LamG domain-containing protein [Gemmatimonadaceae bacterium]|nr:LamG domain-containing protein [Gemmatimonadaceae bacterium]
MMRASILAAALVLGTSIGRAQTQRPATAARAGEETGFTTSWLSAAYDRAIPDAEFVGPIMLADRPDRALQPREFTVEVWYKTPDRQVTGTVMFLELFPPTTYTSPYAAVWFRLNTFNRNRSGLAPVLSVSNGGRYNNFAPERGEGSIADNLALSTWYHLVATDDGKSARIFINGALAGSLPVTGAIEYGPTDARIAGMRNASGSRYPAIEYQRIPGTLRLVKLYNEALSESEVAARYAAGLPKVAASQAGDNRNNSAPRATVDRPSASLESDDASLSALLKAFGATVIPGRENTEVAEPGSSETPLIGKLIWPAGGSGNPVVAQIDSGNLHPMAASGDSLFLFNSQFKRVGSVKIVRRAALKANEPCSGMGFDADGWAYVIEQTKVGRPSEEEPPIVALPVVPTHAGLVKATTAERMAFRPVLKALLDSAYGRAIKNFGGQEEYARIIQSGELKRIIYNDQSGNSRLDTQPYFRVRGPGGAPVFVTSIQLGDDLSDHNGNTRLLLIVGARGNVLARRDGSFNILTVGDTNGDGVDEIILSEGIVGWSGKHWMIPAVIDCWD